MPRLLDGLSTLVTGAGSGIGRATALAFAREGARVAVADRDRASVVETAALIASGGGEALTIEADVAREEDVRAMIERTVASFGRLDAAFNNAGIARTPGWVPGTKIADTDSSAWHEMLAINLTGVFLCLKHELDHMSRTGSGAIVNNASVAGLIGLAGAGMYTATKHGVVGLTKTAALEYAEAGIRINAVCPGYVQTAITVQTNVRHGKANDRLARVPQKRIGQPNEIAETVLWLCSSRSSYTTGACIPIDGGISAG
jgi:NAD(P)-dependent dehydrogenase (short-subunit alcohol dehydrogenase family)